MEKHYIARLQNKNRSRFSCLIKKAFLAVTLLFSFTTLVAQVVVVNPASPFIVPAGVTSIKVECWGGGGGGGGSQNTFLTNRYGGGGGGGGYSQANFTVNTGESYTVTVGAGGTVASNANGNTGGTSIVSGPGGSVSALGGAGGVKSTAATGGAGGVGNTFTGGTGGTGSGNGAGGGGGAGNAGNGGNGSNSAQGIGGSGSPNVSPYIGGNGAGQKTSSGNGNAGAIPGGGGGGGRSNTSTSSGGAGGDGRVVITYTLPAPIITGFTPASACANGGVITINGSNFNNAVASDVQIGGTAVTSITSNNGSQIIAVIGNGTTGTVSVTTGSGTGTSASTFTVIPLPSAPTVTPSSATVTAGIATTFTATGTGSSFAWYSAPTGGTLLGSSDSFSPTACATTNYYAQQTESGCASGTRTTATLNVTPLAAPTTTGGSICDLGAINLSAVPATGGTTCNWYAASSGGTALITNATTAPLNLNVSGTTTFYVSTKNATCEGTARTSVTAISYPKVQGAPTSSDASVCAGGTVNLTANGTRTGRSEVNVAIPDKPIFGSATPVTSSLSVSGLSTALNNTTVRINYVKINITHTFVGDLLIKLTAPDASSFNLSNINGGSGDNFTNTVFQTGGAPITGITAANAPFTGTYAPQQAFSNFNTKNPNGTWGLTVTDQANGDVGNIINWEINFIDGNGLTYSWTSTPVGFSSTTANPTGVDVNTSTAFNVTVNNTALGCSGSGSVSVAANPIPDPLGSSNAPICMGNDINFSADNLAAGQSSGNTYSWRNPSNLVFSTQQNPTISNGTAANNGNYTVTVTNLFLCTASAVVPVVVNPNPVLSVVSQQNESCPGASDGVLTVSAASGTPTYTYTDFVNFNFDGIFANLTPGPITVYVSDDNGCIGSVSATILSPNVPASLTCGGSLNVNTDAGLCSATVSYAQLLAQLTSVTGFPAPVVTFSPDAGNFAIGTTTVTATATNSCGVESCTFDVVVTDAEVPAITCPADGNISVDAGQCTANSVGNPLTSDNCGVATVVANPSGPYALGSHTIEWTVTDVHGNVNSCTQNVTVIDTENPIINGCPSDIVVSNDLGTCGAVVNYVAPGATDNCTLASIIGDHNSGEVFPIGTTTVTYTATDAANNVSTCSFTITVNGTNPTAVTTISSNADFNNICLGSSVQLTANGGSLGNMNGEYKWYENSCGGVLVGTGSTLTVSPTASTTYFVRVEDGCGNITACVSALVTVSTSPVTASVTLPFTGMPSNICNGSVVSLSIPTVNKATQYIWDAPAGAYFNGNPLNVSPFATSTPNVSITYGNPSGSLYSTGVQASNACGSSLRKIQKSRGIVSVPAYVSGQTTVCENSSLSYITPDVDGAATYLWSVTGDATVTGNSNMVTVNFGPTWNGGTLCVAAQTACYTSPTKCLSISKNAALLSNLSGSFTACPNANQTFSVNPSSGAATYAWSLPSGASGSSSTNSINVSFGPSYNSAGNICVSVTSICGVTSVPKCKAVAPGLPSMPSSVSGPLNGLCGQTVVYQCPTQSGTTFNWSVPAGAIINTGQGTNAVSVTYSTLSTSPLCVTASNSCGSSNSRCVTAKGAPNSPSSLTASPGSWCTNTQGVEFTANLANTTGSYTLNWLYPSAPVANYVFGGGNSTSLILDWGTGNGNVAVVASNACGSGSKAFNVNISCREGESVVPQNMFSVFPNPASTFVNVQFNSTDNSNYHLQLTDLSGRLLLDKIIEGHAGLNTQQIDIKHMAKGVYMLLLNGSDSSQKQKIVLE